MQASTAAVDSIYTSLLLPLRLLPGAERPSDGCFGSQKGRAQVRRTRTVQLLVHVGLDGSQPGKEQVVGILVVRHLAVRNLLHRETATLQTPIAYTKAQKPLLTFLGKLELMKELLEWVVFNTTWAGRTMS